MCMYMYICIYTYMYIVYAYICVCMCVYIYIYIEREREIYICAKHTCVYMYVCMYIYIYVYIYIYIYIYICIVAAGHRAGPGPLRQGEGARSTVFKIQQRGVQWKQGVVMCMMLYISSLYNTTPVHCTLPPAATPCNGYPMSRCLVWEIASTIRMHIMFSVDFPTIAWE